MTAITPFGQTGPYCNHKSYPLNTFQAGGDGYMSPTGSTFTDRPPIRAGVYIAEHETAISALAATMPALYVQQMQGLGQLVDISQQQVLINLADFDLHRWPNFGIKVNRFVRGYQFAGVLACKDGYIEYSPMRVEDWNSMVEVMGSPEWAKAPELQDRVERDRQGKSLLKKVEQEIKGMTREELYKRARAVHCPLAPFLNPGEVTKSKQMEFREFFVEIDHPVVGKLKYPSYGFRFPEQQRQSNRPAPLLGQHNAQVYCDRLGLTGEELGKLRKEGVV